MKIKPPAIPSPPSGVMRSLGQVRIVFITVLDDEGRPLPDELQPPDRWVVELIGAEPRVIGRFFSFAMARAAAVMQGYSL